MQEAGPHDAGDGGALEGVEARAHAEADLGEDGAGAGAGEEHAGAEEGAAEEVAVVRGEDAEGGEGAGAGGQEVELAGEGYEDAGWVLVGGGRRWERKEVGEGEGGAYALVPVAVRKVWIIWKFVNWSWPRMTAGWKTPEAVRAAPKAAPETT